jgi:hypothetical protein
MPWASARVPAEVGARGSMTGQTGGEEFERSVWLAHVVCYMAVTASGSGGSGRNQLQGKDA